MNTNILLESGTNELELLEFQYALYACNMKSNMHTVKLAYNENFLAGRCMRNIKNCFHAQP